MTPQVDLQAYNPVQKPEEISEWTQCDSKLLLLFVVSVTIVFVFVFVYEF